MSERPERTTYASSILVSQKPIDATEIVRVRLSQAKLLNDEFSTFFKSYYNIKAQYLEQLHNLVTHSQDLNKNIEQSIISKNVLSAEELKHYNIDAIGHLSDIWNKVISEIKDEISANGNLKNTVERDVITPLTNYTTKDKQWAQMRDLHSKLSEVANTIELATDKVEKYTGSSKHEEKAQKYQTQLEGANATWDSEAPYVFESFEHTDAARLQFLRDSLLRFITAYTDSLNKISSSNERTLEAILNFNPETEIARFAKVSSETSYVPKEARRAAESPIVKQTQQPHSASATPSKKGRVSSIATTATAATVATSVSVAGGEKKDKKRNKLRSKVGSIFHKKDKKDKKLNIADAVPESETSSLNESTNRRNSRTSSFMSSSIGLNGSQSNLGTSQFQSPTKDPSPLAKQQQTDAPPSVPQKHTTPSYVPMSLNQAPLKPVSRASSQANLNGAKDQQSLNSFSDAGSQINTSTQSPVENSFQPSAPQNNLSQKNLASENEQSASSYQHAQQEEYPATLEPQQEQQHVRAPPPPPSRKANTLSNIREDAAYSFEQPVDHQTSHGSLPKPPTNRRDIQSGLFTNLNVADVENNQNKRISSFNSFAGSINALRPQTTGSSLSTSGNMFSHPDMTQPGLNASIAEIVNAKFRDGEQVYGNIVGEIALNYHSEDNEVPTRTNLKIKNLPNFDKLIPNNQIMKKIDEDEFEITSSVILGRTLGALKYSIKRINAPIVVLPAWRYEEHQSSVMLTIRLAPKIAARLEPGQTIIIHDLCVAATVKGEVTTALSKPQGSVNKEKTRVTWRFKEPIIFTNNYDTKLVARFLTETQAQEYEHGIIVKFTISGSGASHVTTDMSLASQDFSEDDPFAQDEWTEVPTIRTLVAGTYTGV